MKDTVWKAALFKSVTEALFIIHVARMSDVGGDEMIDDIVLYCFDPICGCSCACCRVICVYMVVLL